MKSSCLLILIAMFVSYTAIAESSNEHYLTFEEKTYLKKLKEIPYCTASNSLPLDEINRGRHVGIGAEYLKYFQRFIDIPFKLIVTKSWQQSLEYIKSGRCDFIALAAITPQRETFLNFTDTYVDIPFVLVTTQEKFFVSTFSQLTQKKLGILTGNSYVDLLRNDYPDLRVIEIESRQKALKMVDNGELFGYLTGLNLAGYAIQAGGYTSLKINGQFDELSVIELGIGIRKEKSALVSIFNKAINSIRQEDKMRIENSWITIRYEITEDYQRIIQFFIIVSVLVSFLFYRQFQLRKHNRQLADREKQIWTQANYDFLTSLPNRRLFQDRLERQISYSIREKIPFALLLIDLDQFKDVNDSLGHEQGDKLLIEAANRINDCTRQSDTIARLGGDEFVVILRDVQKESNIEQVCTKILEQLKQPFQLIEKTFISASIGITFCAQDSKSIQALLKNADQAMYAAKANGRNRWHYFTAKMQEQALERASLVRDLHHALRNKQFEVHFQPISVLNGGKIYKAEALLRWHHPKRGFVSPTVFIPLLEETRLIIEIGEWVFLEAARQVKIWRKIFHPNFQINVNTSPVQFQDQSTHHWSNLIEDIGIPAQAIGIEITESMLMEGHEDISSHLISLRDLGFQVSLDDFGTGYSSLAYLRRFDIDYLKIDKSFVDHIAENSDDKVLCEAIVVMAHRLGLKVVAEGIETAEQAEILKNCQCDYGQGYHLSIPLPAGAFERFLSNYKKS
ncbi:MAG: EAL domain-containing protein [Colwellia sp.]|nr:EAL domain-containing protein [Colwellia sp.]